MAEKITGFWNRLLVPAAVLVLLASCGKDAESVQPEARKSRLTVASTGSAGIDVKTPVIVKPQSFGMMVVDHDTYTPYQPYLNNIEAKAVGDSQDYTSWSFRYDGSSAWFDIIYLIEKKIGASDFSHADIYAYAPFKKGVSSSQIVAMPYSLADQRDLMWAEQNKSDYNNHNILIDGGDKYVRFDFHHLLCKLQFCFRIKNSAPEQDPLNPEYGISTFYRVMGVTVTPKANTLADTGTFNMRNGSFTRTAWRSTPYSITATQVEKALTSIPEDGSYSEPVSMLINPRDPSTPANSYADDDYVFDFRLYGQSSNLLHASYSMKMADLCYDGEHCGLVPGYAYTFYFTFDNYIHFDGATTVDWVTEDKEYGI